jgi:hypothetical protein
LTSIHKIDELDELFASSNKYKQLYKFIEKKYLLAKDRMDNPFKIFYGLPFYRFDLTPQQHLEELRRTNERCCFNHFIGMPEKHGKRHPLHDYERIMWNDFYATFTGQSEQKLFAVLKATGLGLTEYSIRVMAWMACTSSKYRGKRFAVIAGIRMNIAEDIINRFVSLFDRFPFLNIKQSKAKTIVNNVLVEGYPAVNVDALRSFHNLAFILVDEADFFRKSLQKEIRKVIERYIAKSNPFVYLVSTPGQPYGIFYEIFREEKENSIYKQYEFNYEWGEGKIFTKKEIKEQLRSPSFQQEYNLQFGGTAGNLFSEKAILRNVYSDEYCQKIGFYPYYFYKDIKYEPYSSSGEYISRQLGIDPGFGKDPKRDVGSYTALVLTQWRNSRIEVLYAEELRQPDFNELVEIASVILAKTGTSKVFVDGSNPPFVKSLKTAIGESTKYERYDKKEMERKIWRGDMIVCPIPFNTQARPMMYHMKELVDNGVLVINEKQKNVIDCLKSAYVVQEKLDKERTAHDDLFDALRLALAIYETEERQITV